MNNLENQNLGLEQTAIDPVAPTMDGALSEVTTVAEPTKNGHKGLIAGLVAGAVAVVATAGAFVARKFWKKKHPKKDEKVEEVTVETEENK